MPRPLELPWSNVSKGMTVDLGGKPWKVTKAKPKGKVVKVTVENGRDVYTREMKAKATVAIFRKEEEAKGGRVAVEVAGQKASAQADWMPDKTPEKPPMPKGAAWGNPKGEIERLLAENLNANLVAIRLDGQAGYWVPEVNPDTIASHLFIYHGLDGEQMIDYRKAREHELTHTQAEAEALLTWEELSAMHDTEHANGRVGKVPHWHSKERPVP